MRSNSFVNGLFCVIFACSCAKQSKLSGVRSLPMDSSLVVIMETTGLLTDSCVPACWSRDFSTIKPEKQYTAYIRQNKIDEVVRRIQRVIRPNVDSSFYPLIDYASKVESQKIRVEDVRNLTNQRVKVGLIDGLKQRLTDDELGYIQVSPVIMNELGNEAVFIYELQGQINVSWMVCARREMNKWRLVSKTRLGIS